MALLDYFASALDKIRAEGRYRIFTELKSCSSNKVHSYSVKADRDIAIWCSNDYLCMSKNSDVIEALAQGAYTYGVGSGGTRNISGNSHAIVEVELEISNLHSKEAALVFTSGYIANQATLSTISKIIPNCVIFSDQSNHASIIYGIKESNLEKVIFNHNDMEDLEKKLKEYPLDTPKLIVFEALYSMSGDIPPVEKICYLAKKYNALTYVDEVHSVGIYGTEGAGICEALGFQDQIDIIQGTFAKAYGVIGGYIAAKREIIDSIRSYSPGFIFTTSLPPAIASAILSSIRYVRKNDEGRDALKSVVAKLKLKLKEKGIKFLTNDAHIICIMINSAELCQKVYMELLNTHNIYVQGINFPTVPKGQERLRITPNPFHTDQMIGHLVNSLDTVLKKFNAGNPNHEKINSAA
jgi:5-aminolevulinate synthase